MKSSLKYRLIFLYFLLVFIAMSIAGLFIVNDFKKYNMSAISLEMENVAKNIVAPNIKKEDLLKSGKTASEKLNTLPISNGYEVTLIEPENYDIKASTNDRFRGKNSFVALDQNTILKSLSEEKAENDIKSGLGDNSGSVKNLSFPQRDADGKIQYIIYIRTSLDRTDAMMKNIIFIMIRATTITTIISVIFGVLMSSTITKPINQLSGIALEMGKGDFSKRAKVYSEDEIGQLAITFNKLSARIEDMVSRLAGEKNKLNAIIYHMQDGLAATDTNGNIIHCNPSFMRLLGISGDIIGRPYNEVIAPYADVINLSAMMALYSERGPGFMIIKLGKGFIRASSTTFMDETGRFAGIIIMLQDVTMTQRLEEMRKEFVANVSHELKTPITSIKGYSETLIDGAIDDRNTAKNFLEIIDKEADRMTRIVNDLLQLSRMDYEKENWNFEKSDITALIEENIKSVKLSAVAKNISIDYTPEKKPFFINMDSSKIGQCINNLLTNAIKYNSDGGRIDISTNYAGGWCQISVSDTGIGIPQDSVTHIFDRFYRVDKGRSRASGGTGLGLSIVKEIVNRHKGEIYVKSAPGRGSTFLIRLPSVPDFKNLL